MTKRTIHGVVTTCHNCWMLSYYPQEWLDAYQQDELTDKLEANYDNGCPYNDLYNGSDVEQIECKDFIFKFNMVTVYCDPEHRPECAKNSQH